MNGVLVNGQCLAPDVGEGVYWAGVVPKITDSGQLFTVEFVADAWVQRVYSGGVLQSSAPLPTPNFYPCDPVESVLDGFTLASAVVLVWVIGWSFAILRRAL